MAYESIFQNPLQVVNPKRTPGATLPALRQQPQVSTMPQQPAPQPGQVSMQQFAQSIKAKYPQYANQDDTKLATAFLQKYPQYASKVAGSPAPTPTGTGDQQPQKLGFFKSLIQPELSAVASGIRGIQSIPSTLESGYGLLTGNQQLANEAGAKSDEIQKKDLFGVKTFMGQSIPELLGSAAQAGGQALLVGGAAPFTSFALQGGGQTAYEGGNAKQIFGNALLSGLLGKGAIAAAPYIGAGISNITPNIVKAGVGELTSQAGNLLGKAGEAVNPYLDKIIPSALENQNIARTGFNKLIGNTFPKGLLRSGIESPVGEAIFGTDVADATSRLSANPKNVNAYRTGAKTFDNIATTTKQAIDELETKSKTAFQAVKDSLPGNKVPKIATTKAALQGIPPSSQLTDNEGRIINRLRNLIMKNKDWTDKGVLDLRNRIDRADLYREGQDYLSSNRAVQNARKVLNKAVTDVSGFMQGALDDASANIDLINKLKANLVGANPDVYVERTAKNLNAIMNKLDDPTQFKAVQDLIRELQDRTGYQILPELQDAHAASVLNRQTKFPGMERPTQTIFNSFRRAGIKGVEKISQLGIGDTGIGKAQGILDRVASEQGAVATPTEQKLAQRAYDLTQKNGGVTINLNGDVPTKGYVVAPSKATEVKIPQPELSVSDIQKYIRSHFAELQHPNAHFGTWIDEGNVVLDVSHVYDDPLQAVNIAKKGQQQAIFDLNTFNSIYAKDFAKYLKGK